jgi:hypothetical protein
MTLPVLVEQTDGTFTARLAGDLASLAKPRTGQPQYV